MVVESVHLIQKVAPRFFIFENVAAFMKTGCTAPDGTVKAIGDVVYEELSDKYIIVSRILNFKNYGSNSSRTRTVVIGVSKDIAEYVAPIELYPTYVEERTLRDVIGDMPKLEWGEICPTDFYHSFRTYPEEMHCWIHDLKQGQSAFDNEDELKRPHKIVDGVVVPNKQKMEINILVNIGIRLHLVFIQEMTNWQVKILYIQKKTEFFQFVNL